jgi:hypothetical protein
MTILHRPALFVVLVAASTGSLAQGVQRESFPDMEFWVEPKVEPKPERRPPVERDLPSERRGGTQPSAPASPSPAKVLPPPPAPKPPPTAEQVAKAEKAKIDAEIAWLIGQVFGSEAEVNTASTKLAVLALKRSFVPEYARGRPLNFSQADLVQRALKTITDQRESEKSQNIPLRNAEYYLHGLYAKVAKDEQHEAYAKNAALYSELKRVSANLKQSGFPQLEKLLRANKDQALSPPGGTEWALAGLKDGAAVADSLEGYFPNLPELHEMGPEVILIQPTPYVEDKVIELRPTRPAMPENRIRRD